MRLAVQMSLMLVVCVTVFGQEPQTSPSPISETVVVTATRTDTKIGDTPSSIVTFSRRDLTTSAAPTIDDVLRQSPGFSIFRRSSSRNANPTTQGVSLRGVGASGASRSVVLFDGVPLNDPFGGWVQWNRVPPIEVENVEILRGGASSLYGDTSLSGAVNVIPRKVEDKYLFSGDAFGGMQDTISGSVFTGVKSGGWTADGSIAHFQTKGFIPIEENARGPVDVFSGTRSWNLDAKVVRDLGEHASIFFRPTYFGEVRTNGTGLQTNRTHIRQLIFGGEASVGRLHETKINWRIYGGTQVFDQVFSAVNATRTAESLLRIQRIPAQNVGVSIQFSTVYRSQVFVGGVETRNVRGASDELVFTGSNATSLVGSGGRQNSFGAFFQDFARIGKRLIVTGSVRYDQWRNYAALSATNTFLTNLTATTNFPDREDHSLSPHISALYHLTDRFSIYASASRSFRSPTLNELYRTFRVGNVSTLANENLVAEHANNFEGGVSFTQKSTSLRANAFWANIDKPVSNVTVRTSPTLITRQRQNAGAIRSRGVEVEGEKNFRQFSFSAGYLFVDSTVTPTAGLPTLVVIGSGTATFSTVPSRLAVPQVARHNLTFQARYAPAKWSFAVQGRASNSQFDDDLNTFLLEPYAQIDLFVERRLNENLKIYAAIENVFNTRYSVGKTPIRTVSSPINFRIGLRWN